MGYVLQIYHLLQVFKREVFIIGSINLYLYYEFYNISPHMDDKYIFVWDFRIITFMGKSFKIYKMGTFTYLWIILLFNNIMDRMGVGKILFYYCTCFRITTQNHKVHL